MLRRRPYRLPVNLLRRQRGAESHRRGHAAEFLCRLALRLKGYQILEPRYKSALGEIDIVATRGKTLVFIEVKARPTLDLALQAVSFHQMERLSRTAQRFMAHHRGFSGFDVRFDVMLVLPWAWPLHIQNAFDSTV